jgi:lipoprotein signal peptidase
MNTASPQLRWLWISLLVVILDQAAKQIAEAQLTPHQAVNLFPYFDWYLTYNTGAAFSFLHRYRPMDPKTAGGRHANRGIPVPDPRWRDRQPD